jgi:alpha-tubulin suppressor-like RCC1 family protein
VDIRFFRVSFWCYLAWVVLGGATHAAVFQNLVVNGGFTIASGQSGSGWAGSYLQKSSGPTLLGGGNYFYAGETSSREVTQIYTLTESERALCKGAVGVTEQGMRYFLSADLFGEKDGGDYSRAYAEFRNSAGTIISSVSMNSQTGRPAVWPETMTAGQYPSYRFARDWVPAGTHSIRIRVRADRASGDFNNGYADNIRFELQPSNVLEGEAGEVISIGGGGGVQTRNRSAIIQIAAGYSHRLELKGDGTVVAWGDNNYGQTSVPALLFGVVQVAAGFSHSLALKGDGTVVAWGYNGNGRTAVPAGLSGVVQIAAGVNHSLALKGDGTVVAWGYNGNGETAVPASLSGVVQIAAGYSHSVALKGDGTVVAWGHNSYDQSTVPASLSGVVQIATGYYHILALKADGMVVAWGGNGHGQATVPAGLSGVVRLAAGHNHSLALKGDGTLVAWGWNGYGQATIPASLSGVVQIAASVNLSLALKDDGTVVAWGYNSDSQATVLASPSGFVQIAAGVNHSLALKGDGMVVAWGDNYYGQKSVPAGLSGVVQIAAGRFYNLALKEDGTVVAWGYNDYGQTLVPIGLSGVVQIAPGGNHSLALKGDGTVVAWGNNGYGETTVPAGLSGVVQIAAGYSHSVALKGDGTVVAWGYNYYGQTSVPAGLSDVVQIAAGGYHSVALKGDGTVVAWGYNNDGQASVPAGLSGVVEIKAGLFSSAAKLADGSWITWGNAPSMAGGKWWTKNVLSLALGPFEGIEALRSVQPEPPHALHLAKGAFWENRPSEWQDSLWTDDPNLGDNHTYELVSGEGDEDNDEFIFDGQTLTPVGLIDYEQKSSYRLRAKVSDSSGFTFEKALVIFVVNDDLEDTDGDGVTEREEALLGTSDAFAGYADWTQTNGLTEAMAEELATPFSDGVPNLLKYAFKMRGNRADTSRLPIGNGISGLPAFYPHTGDGVSVFRAEFVRRKNAGLTYVPKYSEALESASFLPMDGPEQITPLNSVWERVVIDEPCDFSQTPRLFGVMEVMKE